MPLQMLPQSLSTITDAQNAFNRLVPVFMAEVVEIEDRILVDEKAEFAISVDADFTWEESPESGADTPAQQIRGIKFNVTRGQLLVIVGPVGSGKSSILQGLLGEMRRTRGDRCIFSSQPSYNAQTPWIQNATIRDNILFGTPFDEKRYWHCVTSCCLLPDLELLESGDQTQIGEKGIVISGGQRARVALCRTLYQSSEIVLLDDPLAAVDAWVGKKITEQVMLREFKSTGKTVILVTHSTQAMVRLCIYYLPKKSRSSQV